jgi:hypothetical protein
VLRFTAEDAVAMATVSSTMPVILRLTAEEPMTAMGESTMPDLLYLLRHQLAVERRERC